MSLEELRLKIDEVDNQLIKLYEDRLEIAEGIAKAKLEIGKEVFDPEREKLKLEVVRNKTSREENKDGVEALFRFLMDESKKRQQEVINE